jgi:hypothetical protein
MEIIDDSSPKVIVNDTVETVSQFEMAIIQATSSKNGFIEVTEDVFNHYMKGQRTPYFFYHDIKVFRVGTRTDIERLEQMLPEDRAREEGELRKSGIEWI